MNDLTFPFCVFFTNIIFTCFICQLEQHSFDKCLSLVKTVESLLTLLCLDIRLEGIVKLFTPNNSKKPTNGINFSNVSLMLLRNNQRSLSIYYKKHLCFLIDANVHTRAKHEVCFIARPFKFNVFQSQDLCCCSNKFGNDTSTFFLTVVCSLCDKFLFFIRMHKPCDILILSRGLKSLNIYIFLN